MTDATQPGPKPNDNEADSGAPNSPWTPQQQDPIATGEHDQQATEQQQQQWGQPAVASAAKPLPPAPWQQAAPAAPERRSNLLGIIAALLIGLVLLLGLARSIVVMGPVIDTVGVTGIAGAMNLITFGQVFLGVVAAVLGGISFGTTRKSARPDHVGLAAAAIGGWIAVSTIINMVVSFATAMIGAV
ncbi:hypothetical protein EG850_03730 [Gulosibacter macacae]|uniref:Uncharacterized protein n=1 Tax=Gulosibacter macacae TaxID=2488791 RepID=A0A3P3VZ31_9MICO|nr:hypothetical protein [Gulosibacter macacae]RRJ87970.1 hypothetical protein EG850_03730 [Gulosibacter macacae]